MFHSFIIQLAGGGFGFVGGVGVGKRRPEERGGDAGNFAFNAHADSDDLSKFSSVRFGGVFCSAFVVV